MRNNDRRTTGIDTQWFVLLAAIAGFFLIPITISAQDMPCSNPRSARTEFVRLGERVIHDPCRDGRSRIFRQNRTLVDPVRISGHITHQNGVRMGGILMRLTDLNSNTTRSVISDEMGNYLFDNIPWGSRVELVPSLEGYQFFPPAVIWEGIVEDEVWNFIAVGPPPPPPPPPANQPTLAWTSYFDDSPQLADYNGMIGRDASGNIYTGGTSFVDETSGDTDIVLFKTDANGNRVWSRSFQGPGQYKDGLRDMAVDTAGNVYMIGYSYSLPEGPSQLRSYNYVTLKYNSNGDLLWAKYYGPNAGYDDFPRSLKIDAAGNAYVAGYSWGINTYANYATVKYDPDGNQIWAQRFAGGFGEILNEVEIDTAGNVYVTGYSNSSQAGGSEDIVTIKYNAGGVQQWLNRYNSSTSDSDEGFEIEIDAAGDVLVLGETYDFSDSTTIVHKIGGTSGLTVWTRPVTGISPDQSILTMAMELDAQGKIILTGMLYDGLSYNVDSFLAKLSPEVTVEWARSYDGPSDEDFDGDPKIVIDADGNIVMALTSEGFANADIQVVKFASDGTEQWTYRFGNPFFGDDVMLSWESEAAQRTLLLDSQGNVYLAGSSNIPEHSSDLLVFKLEPIPQTRSVPFDFDGDRKADISVYRPTTGDWHILKSTDRSSVTTNWGINGDQIVPADYDGDGRNDLAVYRNGVWWVRRSSDGGYTASQFGLAGDKPVPSDFDNDGRADLSVFRQGVWHSLSSSNNVYTPTQFGLADDIPMPADFDSNRRSDLGVFRNGTWYVQYQAGLPLSSMAFGSQTDKAVPADYDGDKRTDFAVYRNGVWWVWQSRTDSLTAFQWGMAGDMPVPADYDGDKKTDFAVFRQGVWYIWKSSDGGYMTVRYGLPTDIPVPSAYLR